MIFRSFAKKEQICVVAISSYLKLNDNSDSERKCTAKGGNTAYYWNVFCIVYSESWNIPKIRV